MRRLGKPTRHCPTTTSSSEADLRGLLTSVRAVGDHRSSTAPRLYVAMFGAIALLTAACGTGAEETNQTQPTRAVGTEVTTRPGGTIPIDVEIQGHRGARGLKPENTLPAFEIALDLLVPTLELDLHLTADGHLVVLHDPEIDRRKCGLAPDATDASDPDSRIRDPQALRVADMTIDQINQYRCDRNPDVDEFPDQDNKATDLAGDDYGVVELEDLFEFVDAYAASPDKTDEQRANAVIVRYNIETKRDPRDPSAIGDDFDGVNPGKFELTLLNEISQRGLGDRVTIQSFDHRSLWAVRSVDPDMILVALSSRQIPDFDDLVARGATIWSPNQSLVSESVVRSAQSAGLEVIVWTVNEEVDMLALLELGVDGLITDRPDIAMLLGTTGE